MMRLVPHLLGLGLVGGLVLAGYHLLADAGSLVASLDDDSAASELIRRVSPLDFAVTRQPYSLSSLGILSRTADHVQEQYVDPDRLDWNAMFRGAVEAVEKEIPEVVLRPEGARLHVQVGDYTTVLASDATDRPERVEALLRRVAAILEQHLSADEIKPEEVEYTLVNGMLATLDPHTVLMQPDNSRKMQEDNAGEFGGLGITIQIRDGKLQIEYPLDGTPAAKAGLKPGDRIVKIEGEGTINMEIDDAVDKMRGPPGTSVTVTIDREGFEAPRDFTIVRAKIKTGEVWGQLLDGGVGYVRIDSFHELVSNQLDDVLADLGRQAGPGGLRGLVLDLRDNPGGYLHQAVAVSDKFLSTGVIVSTVGREGRDRDEKEARASGTEPDYPMAVLMTSSSASAAEIVAGALKNNERAVIIGETSFGKGSVQELYPMPGQAQLKITVARYFTPGDHSIQGRGIPPDIEVKPWRVYGPREFDDDGRKTMSGPRISLFGRDRVLREADLRGHLPALGEEDRGPAYTLRWAVPEKADEPAGEHRDVRGDYEVLFARDVLVAARGGGGRRAEVLKEAGAVVSSHQRQQTAKIEAAFGVQGINWTSCANPAGAKVDVAVSFADDATGAALEKLPAGALVAVTTTVTNKDSRPLCQVVARIESKPGIDPLNEAEFYLGAIPVGGSRSYTVKSQIPEGYPDEDARITVSVFDPAGTVIASHEEEVRTTAEQLPRYRWTWTVSDPAPGGDGDGVVEVGEALSVHLDVTNDGGRGGVLEADIKKDRALGRTVEIERGSLKLDAIPAGGTASGDLTVRVRELPPDGLIPLQLALRDGERFDYASVLKGRFYPYYVEMDKIAVQVGKPGSTAARQPPVITVTREPGSRTDAALVTVSGVATDDEGVRDVILYHVVDEDQQKIAYAGAGGGDVKLRSVPFSGTAELRAGSNLIVVLVRDTTGLVATRAIDVLFTPPVAQAPIEKPAEGAP
jgi:carboxyl-terminal processing protease